MPAWEEIVGGLRRRRCLFLGGGGFKTLSFMGVIDTLGWKHFAHVSGVSAGSVLALLLALGSSPSEAVELVLTDEHLLRGGFSLARLCHGQTPMEPRVLRQGFVSMLETKGVRADVTLAELASRARQRGGAEFSAICFCLQTCQLERFSSSSHPNVPVVDLLLACVAIPLLCSPVALTGPDELYCDAGLVNSCPLSFFDATDTVALVARWQIPAETVTFPQTINLRCNFTAQMSLERNRALGMEVLHVPSPQPGVSLLSRATTPVSAFMDTGSFYTIVYILKAEILRFLAVLQSV